MNYGIYTNNKIIIGFLDFLEQFQTIQTNRKYFGVFGYFVQYNIGINLLIDSDTLFELIGTPSHNIFQK